MTLTWNISRSAGEVRLALKGSLTETTDFAPLLKEAMAQVLVVDVGEIARVNSCGVRAWLAFIGDLDKAGCRVVLERCPPWIVGQLNLISNFIGKDGTVRSVLAPYHCQNCDLEHLHLIDFSKTMEVPLETACPDCKAGMIFDDLPEMYLSFMAPAQSS